MRGRELWVAMTSRPDLLAIDMKRQGRFGLCIPLFPAQGPDDVLELFTTIARVKKIALTEPILAYIRENLGARPLTGSDVESILIRAKERAVLAKRDDDVQRADLEEAVDSFIDPLDPGVAGVAGTGRGAGLFRPALPARALSRRATAPSSWKSSPASSCAPAEGKRLIFGTGRQVPFLLPPLRALNFWLYGRPRSTFDCERETYPSPQTRGGPPAHGRLRRARKSRRAAIAFERRYALTYGDERPDYQPAPDDGSDGGVAWLDQAQSPSVRFALKISAVLAQRDAEGKPYLLIGGQAVYFWASRYAAEEPACRAMATVYEQGH